MYEHEHTAHDIPQPDPLQEAMQALGLRVIRGADQAYTAVNRSPLQLAALVAFPIPYLIWRGMRDMVRKPAPPVRAVE